MSSAKKKYAKKNVTPPAKAKSTEARSTSTESRSKSTEARSKSTESTQSRSNSAKEKRSNSAQKVEEMPKSYASRIYSQREQDEKLTGYLEVSPEIWPQIRYGTHIRYYLKTGEFRSGGFVSKNPFDVFISNDSIQHPNQPEKLNKEKKTYIKIQNGFNDKLKGYYQWIVSYDDIEKIYIKPDAGVLTMVKTLELVVNGLNENIHKLALSSRMLEKRIAQLEK